jgi:hypothetical protein
MELEATIAVIEFLWGLLILIIPRKALGDSQTFDILWWQIPHPWALGIPWVLSAALTFSGITLFSAPYILELLPDQSTWRNLFSTLSRHLRYCAMLRATGAFLSLILWSGTASIAAFNGGTILFIVISICFAAAEVRVLSGATQRAALSHYWHRYYGG